MAGSLLALLLALPCLGCSSGYEELARLRQRTALRDKGDVLVGVVQSSIQPNLTWQGAQLAADRINSGGGILNGRRLRLLPLDDEGDLEEGLRLARRLVRDPRISAVVGHVMSRVAVPASLVYEAGGMLFMSTGATDPQLNLIDHQLTYRTVPTNKEIGWAMAEAAKRMGWERVAVIFERNMYSDLYTKSLAESFSARAEDLGIEVLHTRAFFDWQKDLRPMILGLQKRSRLDALVLVANDAESRDITKQVRGMGIATPILGADSMFTFQLPQQLANTVGEVVVAGFFDPDSAAAATSTFVNSFRTRFGSAPDADGAHAFDAINLLARAMELCGSANPLDMAMALRLLQHYPGVTGNFTFNANGNAEGKDIYFFRVANGRYELLQVVSANDRPPVEWSSDPLDDIFSEPTVRTSRRDNGRPGR